MLPQRIVITLVSVDVERPEHDLFISRVGHHLDSERFLDTVNIRALHLGSEDADPALGSAFAHDFTGEVNGVLVEVLPLFVLDASLVVALPGQPVQRRRRIKLSTHLVPNLGRDP